MNIGQWLFVGLLPIIVFAMYILYLIWLIGSASKQFFVYFLMYVDLYGLDNPVLAVRRAWKSYREDKHLKLLYDDLLQMRDEIHKQLDDNEKSLDSSPELELQLLGELSKVEGSIVRVVAQSRDVALAEDHRLASLDLVGGIAEQLRNNDRSGVVAQGTNTG
ncbi:MAG TPA: hypothetical protein VLK33_15830, partial [Terriglobales bacterium]|nr:hypothetical protein [Terriglobales bacterium]